jgi:DNA repair exonuclease SbcCD ATPase subunit
MVDTYLRNIDIAKHKLSELLMRRKLLKESATNTYTDIESKRVDLLNTEKARIVVQEVANSVQKNLEYRITSIVSLALASVFPDPYEFKVEFVTRRNQTECDFYFIRDGNECDPMDSSGGGALDIASLALRMAIWSIKKTRAIQILDEPCKFLSRDMQSKASEMLKELSEKLGIQMIVVSHIPEMIEAADRVFEVTNKEGVSNVRMIP